MLSMLEVKEGVIKGNLEPAHLDFGIWKLPFVDFVKPVGDVCLGRTVSQPSIAEVSNLLIQILRIYFRILDYFPNS